MVVQEYHLQFLEQLLLMLVVGAGQLVLVEQ
jgi:hypothetical protein